MVVHRILAHLVIVLRGCARRVSPALAPVVSPDGTAGVPGSSCAPIASRSEGTRVGATHHVELSNQRPGAYTWRNHAF